MLSFYYTGRDQQGSETKGFIDAVDRQNAAKQLNSQGIVPINIQPKNPTQLLANADKREHKEDKIHFLTPSVSLSDLVVFSRQMYSLTKAGIPIIRAVAGLATTRSLRLREALLDIIQSLEKGRSFSSALAQHPKIFNQLFVSVVHVGENTGQLDAAFLQLASYLEREQETRKQIKAATRYPSFVVLRITRRVIHAAKYFKATIQPCLASLMLI